MFGAERVNIDSICDVSLPIPSYCMIQVAQETDTFQKSQLATVSSTGEFLQTVSCCPYTLKSGCQFELLSD